MKCLDAFVSKYPNSQLLPYAYLTDCKAYRTTPQVMKYAERVLSSKDEKPKFDVNDRFETALAWAEAYNTMRSTDFALAGKAREIAGIGLELLAAIEKENVPQRKAFPEELRNAKLYLNTTAASAAMIMKDYGAASDSHSGSGGLKRLRPFRIAPTPLALSARARTF